MGIPPQDIETKTGGSTMKSAWKTLLGLTVVLAVVLVARAEDEKKPEKEVTLKGEITCTKCGLSETKACGNAIKVKDGDKEIVYYFKDAGAKAKYHAKICTAPADGSVTGVVTKEKDKNFITPAKDGVKFKE